MENIKKKYSGSKHYISEATAPMIGVVHEVDENGVISVLVDKHVLPVTGYLAPIPGILPMLASGQQVLVLETGEGVGILGCWQPANEMTKAQIEIQDGRLHINATESIILNSGNSSIEIRADGKIRVDGKDIYSIAEGPLRLQGSIIELN